MGCLKDGEGNKLLNSRLREPAFGASRSRLCSIAHPRVARPKRRAGREAALSAEALIEAGEGRRKVAELGWYRVDISSPLSFIGGGFL